MSPRPRQGQLPRVFGGSVLSPHQQWQGGGAGISLSLMAGPAVFPAPAGLIPAGPTPTGHSPNIWTVFQHLDSVPSAGGGRQEAGRRSRLREQCGSHRLGCENLHGGSPARPWRAGGGDQAKAVPGQVGGGPLLRLRREGSRRGQVTEGPSPVPIPPPQVGPHCLWDLQLSFYLSSLSFISCKVGRPSWCPPGPVGPALPSPEPPST